MKRLRKKTLITLLLLIGMMTVGVAGCDTSTVEANNGRNMITPPQIQIIIMN